MKSKIKRHSRSALAVILTLSMLVSCMMVGLIATDAARVTDSGTVGATLDDDSVGTAPASGSTLIVKTGQLGADSNKKYYAYFYGGSITSGNEVWVELTKITAGAWNGKYYCTVPAGSPENVIITRNSSSGSGWSNKEAQSVDITLSGNYAWVADSGESNGKANGGCTSKEFKVLVKNDSTETSYDLTEDNGSGVFSVTTPAITAAATHLEAKCYNSSDNVWYGIDAQNYCLNDTAVGNSYTVTASVDIKNVSTSSWTGSTFSKTLVSSDSHYSLTGDIWSTCITEINGSTNTITRDEPDDGVWWGSYHSDAAIGTPTGTAGEYYIDITTADRATLVAGNPTFKTVDIGLYNNSANKQKAFEIGGTYYNYIGGDYTVTSSGVTANIVDLASSNGGGALKLQPGRSYRITVNENTSKISVEEINHVDKYFLAGQYSDGTTQFFGETWNTSNNELTYNSTSGCYEKIFTTNIPAGTINFKVVKNGDSDGWDGGSWPTDGNQSYVIKANATSVKFSFSTSTEKTTVTQENSSSSGGGEWEPSTPDAIKGHLTDKSNDDNTTVIYAFSTGSSAIVSGSIKTPKMVGSAYWVDFSDLTSELSSVNTTQGYNLYLALTSGSNWSSIYTESGTVTFNNQTYSLGVSSGGVESYNSNGAHYFARVSFENPNTISHLGVLISKPEATKHDFKVYTTAQPPAPVVDIYAKDATLRDDTFNRFARLATTTIDSTYFDYTDDDGNHYNSITAYNNAKDPDIVITRESYGGTDAGYTKMTNVPVGAKVKIKTTLSDNASAQGSFDNKAFKETHYVKGYSFNGVTYQINEWESDGVYEEIWTVRAVNTTYKDSNGVLQKATTGGKVVEVTPIYYMKDNKNCKTFYIDGYDGTVQNAWGNMLCVYPYYEGKSFKENAFGGYPGQPMLLWGGKYQMEIPLTVDGTASGASVKGLTLHNAYWDLLHRSIDIRCNARNHAQTYDYDDFYKLYKEKNPDTIIFDFKYKTANDNFGDSDKYFNYEFAGTSGSEQTKDAAHYAASGKNGVEIITDYFGRQVDVFGNLLTDAQKSDYDSTHPQDKELLIVSTGYKDTYVGEYATLWAVYAPQSQSDIPSGSGDTPGKFIGLISSSELYLNTWENTSKYPVSDHGLLMTDSRFENTYKHLKKYYTGVPALITYEKEIWNNSKDKANRSDGKWYYSNTSDKVSANIKIQYGAYSLFEAPDHSVSSDAWNDDPFNQSKTGVGGYNNIGTNTGCSAYFTNTTPNLNGKVASGEQFADSTKKFTFQAVPSGSYMFAGWVRYSNGKYYEITENEIGESPMSSNDVYIARFVTAKTGSLTVQHVVEQTNEYNGTGTPALTVTVKDGSGNNVSGSPFSVSDGSKIDISKWIDARNATYTINISMTTTPSNESFMKNIASSSGNYAASPNTWNASYNKTNSSGADTAEKTATVDQFTVQEILDSGITSLRYVSHLMKPVYTYQYEIVYTYTSRFWGTQSYTQTGTCEDGDFTGSKTTAKLTTDFIIGKTPYEKNFRQQINWNYTEQNVTLNGNTANAMVNNPAGTAVSTNTYKMTAHVYSSNTVNDRVTAEFILPYYYNGKDQGYTVKDTDVYTDNDITGKTYLYDTGNESVSLSAKAYNLFTYDDLPHTGSDDVKASSLPLMEAAPYLMTNLGDNDYHYKLTDNIRYYTGNSFKVGDTTYYKSQDDVPAGATNFEVLDGNDSVTFRKIKYQPDGQQTTYHFAVEDTSEGAKGEYGYKVYFFSYVTDDYGNYLDNNNNIVDTPTFNGQYCVYSVNREIDGIIKDTGVKKYFTRWDIYNTKGDFVASCYNRRFNYSGYDNYVVRPIYESDTEQNYASSSGIDNRTLANITYLGDTRNQWKGDSTAQGQYGTVTEKTDGDTAGDKLIHDFALAYAYNGLEISKVPSSTPIKVGMIIEQLDVLDSAGGTKIVDSSYYAEKYNKSSNAHRPEVDMPKIKNWLEGKAGEDVKLSNYLGHTCINSKIGNNLDNNWGQKFGSTPAANSPTNIMSFDSVIDNFNRLQWFYTFTNTKTGEGGTIGATNNANYAYRAWAYIIVNETATVSSTPVYFTLYDSASR